MQKTVGAITGTKLSVSLYQEIRGSKEFKEGHWREEASCVILCRDYPDQHSYDEWFPFNTPSKIPKKIAAICGECPVRLECLTYAIQILPINGIWAGYSYRGIRRMSAKINARK